MSGRRVYGKRDQMSLGVVALDQFPFRIRASGVEIAQYGDAQVLCAARMCEDLLADKLGLSVRIDRTLRRILNNWLTIRNAIRCTRTREHNRAGGVAQHRLDNVDKARDIDPIIGERARHRFSDIGQSGKMDDGAGPVSLERRIERGEVENIALDEWAPAHEIGVAS